MSKEIPPIQAKAIAESLYPQLTSLEWEQAKVDPLKTDPLARRAVWIQEATKIIAEAIIAENRKHYDIIRQALDRLQANAMTDAEIEQLLR